MKGLKLHQFSIKSESDAHFMLRSFETSQAQIPGGKNSIFFTTVFFSFAFIKDSEWTELSHL